VAVEISDFGPGLSPEVQANLFQPFFTTKPAGKGTGLGLAVSMHLVAEMGGQLSAENAENGGARFTVRLASA
jgi:C4-dicarboxylate-specific signal transduction histidine kinase